MSLQNTYTNPEIGMPGQLVGISNGAHEIGSYINDTGSAKQTVDITITAQNATLYTVTINGVAVTYTSDASGTIAEIRQGLIDAAREIQALDRVVVFQNAGALLRVRAFTAGVAFTHSVGANLSESVTTANATQTPIKFGRAVVRRTGGNATAQSARLPFGGTAQVTTVTVTGATNAKVYSFVIVTGGVSYLIDYTADGSATTAEISAGLTARVNALGVPVTAADTTDELTLTADVPGVPFEVQEVDAQLTVAETTANVSNSFLGVACRHHNTVSSTNAEDPEIAPLKVFSAVEKGRVYVEVEHAVDIDDPAYFRSVAAGSEELGMWRSDADGTDGILVPGAKFKSATTGAGIAELMLP